MHSVTVRVMHVDKGDIATRNLNKAIKAFKILPICDLAGLNSNPRCENFSVTL